MLQNFAAADNLKHEELKKAIEHKNFARAEQLAASLHLAGSELKRIQHQALCQMAATYRNAHGTKILAQKYGYSKQEVKQILEEYASEIREDGNSRPLKVCYDILSGKYLTFEDWIIHYMWFCR